MHPKFIMPRKYIRKTADKSINVADLVEAIKSIKNDKQSVSVVAVNKRIQQRTLYRHLKRVEKHFPDFSKVTDVQLTEFLKTVAHGGKTIFTAEQEEALKKYLIKASEICYGLSRNEVRRLALEFAQKINISFPKSWADNKIAGRDWYDSFTARHRLVLRTPQHISANRMKAFNKTNVDGFFDKLKTIMTANLYGPARIWNMDESGFPTVPTKTTKVVTGKGSTNVGKFASQERGTNVTLALAVNAAGQHIPPFYLFPRKNMRSDFLSHATPESVGYANESGWMNAEYFIKFMRHFIQFSSASKKSPSLLILDNHSSHLSIEAIDLAVSNGIVMLSLPPHCSHRMQPLDVSVFAPLKTMYRSQCDAWCMRHGGKLIEIQHVPEILDKCFDLAVTAKNIKSGFQATGIYPPNPNIFTDEDFQMALISGENASAVADAPVDENDQRQLLFFLDPPAAEEEVATSVSVNVSTSSAASTSNVSLDASLISIGPVQRGIPRKKSNRGRKPMQSTILTSAENRKVLKKSPEKKAKVAKKALPTSTPAKKRQRKQTSSSSSSLSDEDFCIICLEPMPKRCNRSNSIKCNDCKREVHLKCASATHGFWICSMCEPESD